MARLVSRRAGLDASGTTNESMSTISMGVFLRLARLLTKLLGSDLYWDRSQAISSRSDHRIDVGDVDAHGLRGSCCRVQVEELPEITSFSLFESPHPP